MALSSLNDGFDTLDAEFTQQVPKDDSRRLFSGDVLAFLNRGRRAAHEIDRNGHQQGSALAVVVDQLSDRHEGFAATLDRESTEIEDLTVWHFHRRSLHWQQFLGALHIALQFLQGLITFTGRSLAQMRHALGNRCVDLRAGRAPAMCPPAHLDGFTKLE